MPFTMNLVSANRSVAIRRGVLQATVLMKCLLLTDLFLNLSKRINFCRWSTAGMFAVKRENSLRISTCFIKANSHGCSEGSRISQMGAKPYYLAKFFAENCKKMKQIRPGGEERIPGAPMDPPLGSISVCVDAMNGSNQSVALSPLQLLTQLLCEYTRW